MRIISGIYKGKQLFTPKDLSVRPTTDKVRNAVFSVLFDKVVEARVLDLFCGTGAYGLEALSRGAESALFVDTDTAYVKKNIQAAGAERTEVLKGDAAQIVSRLSGKFDLVFIDPPYGTQVPDDLLNLLRDRELLAMDAIVVYEESIRNEFIINAEGYGLTSEKKYGDTVVRFFTYEP